jgi:hypothetical protein
MELTQEYLKSILDYDPVTGIFTWKISRKNHMIKGKKAGGMHNKGYIVIGFNYKVYKAHRLAWLYVYGKLPKFEIDHKNRIRDDNRILNLRQTTNSCQNAWNRKGNSDLGIKGITKSKYGGWMVRITKNKVRYYFGIFKTIKEAVILYNEKIKELHGEYACINDINAVKD